MNRLDAPEDDITANQLVDFVALGWRLAGQMAEANFRTITASRGWTMADVETETDKAIERMEIAARDMLIGKGADLNSSNWREIWMAMEAGYRETMAGLLKALGRRGGGSVHYSRGCRYHRPTSCGGSQPCVRLTHQVSPLRSTPPAPGRTAQEGDPSSWSRLAPIFELRAPSKALSELDTDLQQYQVYQTAE